MNEEKRSRGRPKGTGIDDQEKLIEIGRLVLADPSLKPTTAIRSLGYDDPSTVRRLRDKFNAKRNSIMREISGVDVKSSLNDNQEFRMPTAAARDALRSRQNGKASPMHTFDARSPMPKDVISTSDARSGQQKELSCLLAIGAHALAQAAARCVDDPMNPLDIDDSDESQVFLAKMLLMISEPAKGDEPTAR